MIDQPEVGLLGFLVRRRSGDGAIEMLVQAKPEPGNVGLVQLAPTVQATLSNYMRVHGGRPTPYLDRFIAPDRVAWSSSLQSEQGSRFLGKYNLNEVVEVGDDVEVASDEFLWAGFDALQQALITDYAVNTDARSVLVSVPWGRLLGSRSAFDRTDGDCDFRALLRASWESRVGSDHAEVAAVLAGARRVWSFDRIVDPLTVLPGWVVTEDEITAPAGGLGVVQVAVSCTTREVETWDQPLLESGGHGVVTLLCQVREGVLRFLFCARPELGFVESVQLGPSIQHLGGPSLSSPVLERRSEVLDEIASRAECRLEVAQSDEGGRFMQSVTRYSICQLPADVLVPEVPWSLWLSLASVQQSLAVRGTYTNEARSVLSLLLGEL